MSDICPYCPPPTSWGMSPKGLEDMKKWHDNDHPKDKTYREELVSYSL